LNSIKSVPCLDCKKNFPPYVMDFDHVKGTKKFSIGSEKTHALDTIKKEIEKCEVVCSNCHRIRTWNRSHTVVA
jgi:hypothetical protein